MKLPLTATFALVALSAVARAQVLVPVSQDRTVTAEADAGGGDVDSATDSATDFGLYDMSVSVSAGTGAAMAGASQVSEITPCSFLVSGAVSASGVSGGSETRASLFFDVTVPVSYTASGNYESYDQGYFDYLLETASGTHIASEFGILEGPRTFQASGVLQPGSYHILFRATGCACAFAFADFDAELTLTPMAQNYCAASTNSTGGGAQLAIGGSPNVTDNDFRVEAQGVVPNVFGLVFYGPNQIQTTFGDGLRCVGGQIHRVQPPIQADGSGFLSKPIDFTSGPAGSGDGQITADSTWNFQLWYRDPMGPGGTGFNTSDGLEVIFCE